MRIAVIGTGKMGSALGAQLVRAGHEVRVGSRDAERGWRRALEIHAAFGGGYRDAVEGSDAVLLAVPWAAAWETLIVLGDLDGRILIDVTNPFLAGSSKEQIQFPGSSGAEQLQALAPDARVVKAWNTLYSETIRRSPRFDGARPTRLRRRERPGGTRGRGRPRPGPRLRGRGRRVALRRPLSRAARGADDLARPGLGRPARARPQAARADRGSPPGPGCERDQPGAFDASPAAVGDLQSRDHGESEEGQGLSRLGLSDDAHSHRSAQAVDEDDGDRARAARHHEAVSRVSSPTTESTSPSLRARCMPCSARTARARPRSRTSSPASTSRTRARCGSTASRSRFASPRRRDRRAAIGMVHQHFRLVEPFTVAENIMLGDREEPAAASLIDPGQSSARVRRAGRSVTACQSTPHAPRLAALGRRAAAGRDRQGALPGRADPDPRRADRPCSRPQEADGALRRRFGRWRPRAGLVIFISHKLHEVLAVADRITVLRAGRAIATVDRERGDAAIARGADGRSTSSRPRSGRSPPPPRGRRRARRCDGLRVRRRPRRSRPCSGVVARRSHGGEIVAVAGVSGNGQRELA